MAHRGLTAVVATARRAAALLADSTDGRLLTCFLADRDADAFAALVARHGPMVLGVCRRILRHAHDAEDAFQAVFLVLARRADAVRPREAVAGFLHGVAVRTALQARTMTARRRARVQPTPDVPDVAAPAVSSPDLAEVIDVELARLPEKYRTLVVLCDLEGEPQPAVAERLRLPVGTVYSRLATARRLLAERLRSRGLAAAGLAVLAGRSAPAAVPGELAAAAVRVAIGSEVPPAIVAELSREVLRTMLLKKLKLVSAGVLMLLAGVAGLMVAHGGTAGEPPSPPTRSFAARRAPVPNPAPREGVILVTSLASGQPAELFKPDGTPIREPKFGTADSPVWGKLSPDGKRVAIFNFSAGPQIKKWLRGSLHVFDLDSDSGSTEPTLDNLYSPWAVWAPDGKKLYWTEIDPKKIDEEAKPGQDYPLVSWVYDFKTKSRTMLAVPPGHRVEDVSPDGQALLTTKHSYGDLASGKMYLIPLATLKPVEMSDSYAGVRFSPDGKCLIGWRARPRVEGRPVVYDLLIVTLADRSEARVKLSEEVSSVSNACWSPDGKRILYSWLEEIDQPKGTPIPAGPGPHVWYASRVNTADPDGSRPKTIIRREWNQNITSIDWR
jgi:RNA polymerase sigma factor (sigma-70 family)